MSGKRALVTGATGFVGKHLVRRLVRDGWQVSVLARTTSSIDTVSDIAEKVTAFRHDGSTGGMMDMVREAAPDVVFHLASLFLAQHTPEDVEGLVRSNVLFGTQLLEGMGAAGVTRLVNAGTAWQHYENSDYRPVCLYAATKQAFEAMLEYYVDAFSVNAVTLKLYDTYGPEDTRRKLFAVLRENSLLGTPIDMSPGEQIMDVVYIDDIVEAFVTAAGLLMEGRLQGSRRYALSSGAPLRLRDLVETYARVTGRELKVNWGSRPYRHREVMVPWDRGMPLPGWEPRINLESGIRLIEDICGGGG